MPTYEPFDWYQTPLYYDIIFDTDTAREADFLEAVTDRYVRTRGSTKAVLEPACGSGRLMLEFERRGWTTAGVDLCKPILDFAATRGVQGELQHAPMQDFRFRRKFDLAHCLVSSFKYLPTEDDAAACLGCVADHLKSGGVFVLGLHLSDYTETGLDHERWTGSRDGVEVVCNIRGWPADRRTRTERVRSRIKATEHGRTRHFETNWTFRTYELDELQALLAREPRFEHVATYNFEHDINHPIDFDGSWYDNVLILRKQ